ncbi:hypothetical protein ZWY2020_057735 [Hordeum vulgare]|nr:hypothetical protein ZWY2020_057735 [Hordeum vulgare]
MSPRDPAPAPRAPRPRIWRGRPPPSVPQPEPQPSPASLAQRDALHAVEEFFSGRGSSDEDGEDEGSEPEDGGDATAGFFLVLFKRDAALRSTTSGATRRGSSAATTGASNASTTEITPLVRAMFNLALTVPRIGGQGHVGGSGLLDFDETEVRPSPQEPFIDNEFDMLEASSSSWIHASSRGLVCLYYVANPLTFRRELQNDIDLLNPLAELENLKHKKKRLVQSPNSFFMVLDASPSRARQGRLWACRLAGLGWEGVLGSYRNRRNKTHTLCIRYGCRNFHMQKSTCSLCGYPTARFRKCKSHRQIPFLYFCMRFRSFDLAGLARCGAWFW